MSRHMAQERELLAKRQMLEQDAKKKYDELDEIFQQIAETNAKIEEQRQKQHTKTEWGSEGERCGKETLT